MRPSIRAVSMITLAAMLGLTACKQQQSADALQENAMEEVQVDNMAVVNEPDAAPVVVERTLNTTNTAAAPPPAFTDNEQMRDDADATGLTSRLPAEDTGPSSGDNETQPAK